MSRMLGQHWTFCFFARNERSPLVPCSFFQLWVSSSWSTLPSPHQMTFLVGKFHQCIHAKKHQSSWVDAPEQLHGHNWNKMECSACLLGKYECKDANCPWHCLVVAEVLQMCVGSQAIKCQKPTHKNESISTSTSHGKYFRFWLCLARADCRQPASLMLVISAFSCIQCPGDNVNPHWQHIFHQQQNNHVGGSN